MKSILFFLGMLGCGILCLHAQEKNPATLFPEFRTGIVYFQNGKSYQVNINYDYLEDTWFFLDTEDRNIKKQIDNIDEVTVIRVGSRSFIPSYKGVTEVLQGDPYFAVQRSVLTRGGAKSTSYGGNTETASVDQFTGLTGKGIISGREIGNREISSFDYEYTVRKGKKNIHFSNDKALLKAFDKENREKIKKYLQVTHPDYSNPDSVLAVYNHLYKSMEN